MNKNDEPIVVEATFDAALEAVWDSITRVDLMRQWYFENIPSFEPRVGFETGFNVHSGERDFFHIWKVIEAVPRKRIAYSWNYDAYPGDAVVFFDLSEQDNKTKLTLKLDVRENFPDDIPEFKRDSCIAGWEFFIKERLKEFLDKY